jgi:RNA polymerase sigma factor (sigma-70 family)
MAQGNVIAAARRRPLCLAELRCSIRPSSAIVSGAERTISNITIRAGKPRTESGGRRSALMAAAQAGDRVAFETLLRDCVSFIAGIARRQGVPPDQTDDVVQEVLLTVHRARATYDPRRSFEAWLRVITERRAIDLLRQLYRQQSREVHSPLDVESHADEAADASAAVEQAERTKLIDTALTALPSLQRQAVHHLLLDARSLKETEAITGRSRGSLKVSLHRALNALRTRMGHGD